MSFMSVYAFERPPFCCYGIMEWGAAGYDLAGEGTIQHTQISQSHGMEWTGARPVVIKRARAQRDTRKSVSQSHHHPSNTPLISLQTLPRGSSPRSRTNVEVLGVGVLVGKALRAEEEHVLTEVRQACRQQAYGLGWVMHHGGDR